jgi:hypothetical protein
VASMPPEELRATWHLIETDGTRLIAGRAGVALLEHIPTTRLLGRALRGLRLFWIAGAADWIVKNGRGWLSRWVPDVPAPRRVP